MVIQWSKVYERRGEHDLKASAPPELQHQSDFHLNQVVRTLDGGIPVVGAVLVEGAVDEGQDHGRVLARQAAGIHQVLIVPQKQGALRHLVEVTKEEGLGS